LYRDTAPGGFDPVPAPGQISGRQWGYTAIAPAFKKICNMIAKTAPCFTPYGLIEL